MQILFETYLKNRKHEVYPNKHLVVRFLHFFVICFECHKNISGISQNWEANFVAYLTIIWLTCFSFLTI